MRTSLYQHQIHFAPRIVFLVLFVCLAAIASFSQTPSGTPPLTLPSYQNLPVSEGFFPGADGVRLFYRVIGSGKRTVVFLHGGPALGFDDGGYNLEPLAARGYKLIMFDERGGGRSELITDKAKLGVDSYVRDLEALRQHFGLEQMALIGLSWGSSVVTHYTAAHPERVSRIVFLSPMPLVKQLYWKQRWDHLASLRSDADNAREKEIDRIWEKASDAELRALCREYYSFTDKVYYYDQSKISLVRGDICGHSLQAIRNSYLVAVTGIESLGDWDFRPMLAKLRMPVLVVEGEKTNVPLDATEEWARSIPKARLFLVPNAGHMNWIEQPDAFFPVVDRFLKGKWSKGLKQLQAADKK